MSDGVWGGGVGGRGRSGGLLLPEEWTTEVIWLFVTQLILLLRPHHFKTLFIKHHSFINLKH